MTLWRLLNDMPDSLVLALALAVFFGGVASGYGIILLRIVL